jgi:hypothetical protein
MSAVAGPAVPVLTRIDSRVWLVSASWLSSRIDWPTAEPWLSIKPPTGPTRTSESTATTAIRIAARSEELLLGLSAVGVDHHQEGFNLLTIDADDVSAPSDHAEVEIPEIGQPGPDELGIGAGVILPRAGEGKDCSPENASI